MKKRLTIRHEFVPTIPTELEDGIVYVCVQYGTAVHKCCCGCGEEVVTPISPTDWKVIFDGESISLYPSIGNWSLECRSHYWIWANEVSWARTWSSKEIQAGRDGDKRRKEAFFSAKQRGEQPQSDSDLKDVLWSLGGQSHQGAEQSEDE